MYKKGKAGFTLIELLVVVAIIGILVAVIVLFVNTSRAKAQDTKTREVLSNVRSAAQEEKTEKGTFSDICVNGKAYSVITTLASQNNLGYEEYKCYAGLDEFVVVFPLKAEDGYWCIDGENVAKKVGSMTLTASPYNCGALPAVQNGPNTAPVLTLSQALQYRPGAGRPENWVEPSYTAVDTEEGDISSQVTKVVTTSLYSQILRAPWPTLMQCTGDVQYAVTDHGTPPLTSTAIRHFSYQYPDEGSCYGMNTMAPGDCTTTQTGNNNPNGQGVVIQCYRH